MTATTERDEAVGEIRGIPEEAIGTSEDALRTFPELRKATTERDEAIAHLREILKPGDTVYTILRHVSRSGMQRRISLVAETDLDGLRDITYWTAKACQYRMAVGEMALVVNGAGMDMGFDVVDTLSSVLGWRHSDGEDLDQRWL